MGTIKIFNVIVQINTKQSLPFRVNVLKFESTAYAAIWQLQSRLKADVSIGFLVAIVEN